MVVLRYGQVRQRNSASIDWPFVLTNLGQKQQHLLPCPFFVTFPSERTLHAARNDTTRRITQKSMASSFPTIQPRLKSSFPAQYIQTSIAHHQKQTFLLLQRLHNQTHPRHTTIRHDKIILHHNLTPVEKLHLQAAELNGAISSTASNHHHLQQQQPQQ